MFKGVAEFVHHHVTDLLTREKQQLAVQAHPTLQRATAPPSPLVFHVQIGESQPNLLCNVRHPRDQRILSVTGQPASQCGVTRRYVADRSSNDNPALPVGSCANCSTPCRPVLNPPRLSKRRQFNRLRARRRRMAHQMPHGVKLGQALGNPCRFASDQLHDASAFNPNGCCHDQAFTGADFQAKQTCSG